MNAFAEKADQILRFLKDRSKVDWPTLYLISGLNKDDALLAYLRKVKLFIEFTNSHIWITEEGKNFISNTSFVEQRDKTVK